MPAWIYALAACAVAWVVFVAVFHPFRRGAHAAPRALPVRVDAGSMVLAEEQTAWLSSPPLRPEDLYDWPAHDWTAVDLATGERTEGRHPGGPVRFGPGSTATLAPLGGQLGPRARDVLDRYNARCVERWGHAIAG